MCQGLEQIIILLEFLLYYLEICHMVKILLPVEHGKGRYAKWDYGFSFVKMILPSTIENNIQDKALNKAAVAEFLLCTKVTHNIMRQRINGLSKWGILVQKQILFGVSLPLSSSFSVCLSLSLSLSLCLSLSLVRARTWIQVDMCIFVCVCGCVDMWMCLCVHGSVYDSILIRNTGQFSSYQTWAGL